MVTYQITKQFTTGLLAGITIQEQSAVALPVGAFMEKSATTPSAYVVMDCEVIA